MRRAPVLLAVLAVAAACSSSPSPTDLDDAVATALSTEVRQSATLVDEEMRGGATAPITIHQATIAGDTLVLSVSHGGGCADHRYALLVSQAWRESSPVQVGARLAHDDGGDRCKALISRELRFSLVRLREAYVALYGNADRRISIALQGAPGSLLYTF